jgi:hypothetical protein
VWLKELQQQSTKCKFNINLGTTSAPTKLRLKTYETGTSAENEYIQVD